MKHTLSMSNVNLALLCAYSYTGSVELSPRSPGAKTRRGTGAHGLIEDWFWKRTPRAVDEDVAGEARRIADQMIRWLEPKRDRILHCEVGLRYDAENDDSTVGPKRGEDGYADVGAMVLPGTLDLVLRGEDGVLEVLDVKTGDKRYVHNEQVETQGLAVARLLREKRVRVGFVYPRLTKCDEPEMWEMDETSLDVHAGIVHGLMRHLPVAQPEPGEWCWRCDARPNCPAYREQRAESSENDLEQAGYFG